eukprot:CFRG2304T1
MLAIPTNDDLTLIRSSWKSIIAGDGSAGQMPLLRFVEQYYKRLFRLFPDSRAVFKTRETQSRVLLQTLQATLEPLDSFEHSTKDAWVQGYSNLASRLMKESERLQAGCITKFVDELTMDDNTFMVTMARDKSFKPSREKKSWRHKLDAFNPTLPTKGKRHRKSVSNMDNSGSRKVGSSIETSSASPTPPPTSRGPSSSSISNVSVDDSLTSPSH